MEKDQNRIQKNLTSQEVSGYRKRKQKKKSKVKSLTLDTEGPVKKGEANCEGYYWARAIPKQAVFNCYILGKPRSSQ